MCQGIPDNQRFTSPMSGRVRAIYYYLLFAMCNTAGVGLFISSLRSLDVCGQCDRDYHDGHFSI